MNDEQRERKRSKRPKGYLLHMSSFDVLNKDREEFGYKQTTSELPSIYIISGSYITLPFTTPLKPPQTPEPCIPPGLLLMRTLSGYHLWPWQAVSSSLAWYSAFFLLTL